METSKKQVVEVRCVFDDDVEKIIKPLSAVNIDTPASRATRNWKTRNLASGQKTPRRMSSRKSIITAITEENSEGTSTENVTHGIAVAYDTPKEALLGDADIQGQQMFGFQTPKRKDALAQKALQSFQTPEQDRSQKRLALNGGSTPTSSRAQSKRKTLQRRLSVCTPLRKATIPSRQPQTPSTRLRHLDVEMAKTPYNLRRRIGKKILQMTKNESCDSDISASESEYCPSDENEEDDIETDDGEEGSMDGRTGNDSSDNDHANVSNLTKIQKRIIPRKSGLVLGSYAKESDYKLQPEQYFSTQANKKHHTSGRLLGSRLGQDTLQKLLSEVPEIHNKYISKLCKKQLRLFPHWHFALREGFSILLYGVGSKRKLLQSFQETVMDDCDVLVVNGFFPSLSISEVVSAITKNILDLSNVPADLYECLEIVQSWYSGSYKVRLYLIVHNIDGEMLRSDKCQDVLSRLASAPNIHLLASMDHVNAPLVWDQVKLSCFNFTWWDVTNFLPYFTETSFECSVMVKNSGSLALSSLNNVFKALTSNARSIFLLIARRHIENKGNNNFRGVLFRDLYQACRDALLVSSDLALRSQLTDFLDHHMLKSRRGADGSEYLHIPVEMPVLTQFMTQHDDD